jgi:hypothetical protein
MLDRLDRTLNHFVDDGRIAPEVAAQISQEFHVHPVDVRQRLAELAGYAGAGLATVGLVIIGSQVWTDFSVLMRAAAPALVSAALLVGACWLTRSVDHIREHPVRGRVAQTMGAASAVLALLAIIVAFSPESGDMRRVGCCSWQRAPLWSSRCSCGAGCPASSTPWRAAVFAFVTGLSLDGCARVRRRTRDGPGGRGAWCRGGSAAQQVLPAGVADPRAGPDGLATGDSSAHDRGTRVQPPRHALCAGRAVPLRWR